MGPGVPLDAYLGPARHDRHHRLLWAFRRRQAQRGRNARRVGGRRGGGFGGVSSLAKIKGLRVVGIAGSDEKCAWLTGELGADAAINYKSENVYKALRKACPNGVDVYFENVGGPILDAVLGHINIGARIPLCGFISQYAATEAGPGIQNLSILVSKRAKIEGFLVLDYYDRAAEAVREMAGWLKEGRLKFRSDIHQGLKKRPHRHQQTIHRRQDGQAACCRCRSPPREELRGQDRRRHGRGGAASGGRWRTGPRRWG